MNYWFIILVVLVGSMIVGPIMMFRPSTRDKKLAALRQAAAQKGIRIRLVSKKQYQSPHTIAVYSIPSKEVKSGADEDNIHSEWLLVRQSFVHPIHFSSDWDWQDKKKIASVKEQPVILSLLNHLDKELVGIELSKNSVGLWWTERSHSIEDIERLLRLIRGELLKNSH